MSFNGETGEEGFGFSEGQARNSNSNDSAGYSLRENSKRPTPAKFRDYVAGLGSNQNEYDDSINKGRLPTKRQPNNTQRGGKRATPQKRASLDDGFTGEDDDIDPETTTQHRGPGRPPKNGTHQSDDAQDYYNQQGENYGVPPGSEASPFSVGGARGAAGEGGAGMVAGGKAGSARTQSITTDLSYSLKENLRRLKNVLKLPKARRWVYCEYFYSGVDHQLFLGDNEFQQCLRESFPNLKTRKLNKTEWRTIRRLIGKPRRCSQAFFEEERAALDAKRARVRQVYEGTLVQMTPDVAELPARLPRPLIVGAKIYARVRSPKDGIYAGTIDAVLPEAYRIVFDKEDMVPAMIINDSEVMSEAGDEMVSLAYFLEQNRAAMPNYRAQATGSGISPSKLIGSDRSPLLKTDPMVGSGSSIVTQMHKPHASGISARRAFVRDERVGNFPVRMLVMLVKLAKLIEMKRGLVVQLTELNDEAERINLLSDRYPFPYQEKYAQVVVDLETLNKQMHSYLSGISDYASALLPHMTEISITSRPDALRKLCHTHAVQIVKHCNNGLNVQSRRTLDVITSLTALLLQVRSLGQQRCSAFDLHTLSESLAAIRLQIAPKNAAAFQDNVEVHMKQIHQMMLQSGANL